MENKKESFDYEALKKKTLEQFRSGKSLFGKDGAFAPLLQDFLESALQSEMDEHLTDEERFNRKQTVDLLIFNESFDFISFPIFLPCNKKLQEHWVIKLNIQTIK